MAALPYSMEMLRFLVGATVMAGWFREQKNTTIANALQQAQIVVILVQLCWSIIGRDIP